MCFLVASAMGGSVLTDSDNKSTATNSKAKTNLPAYNE